MLFISNRNILFTLQQSREDTAGTICGTDIKMRRDNDVVQLGFKLLWPGTINQTRKNAQEEREIGIITSQPPSHGEDKGLGM